VCIQPNLFALVWQLVFKKYCLILELYLCCFQHLENSINPHRFLQPVDDQLQCLTENHPAEDLNSVRVTGLALGMCVV